jgi:hypothetical protein
VGGGGGGRGDERGDEGAISLFRTAFAAFRSSEEAATKLIMRDRRIDTAREREREREREVEAGWGGGEKRASGN